MIFRVAACRLLFLVLFLLYAAPGLAEDVHVEWVPDGDTLYLKDGRWVRLLGIDAPEMGGGGSPEQFHARESRDFLRRLVEGRPIRLKPDTLEKDRYDRFLAYVYLPDGRMANEIMVKEGLAFFYPHAQQDKGFQSKMLEAQNRAILESKGFWPRILSLPQPRTGWVGNRRSKRFHHPESPYANRISAANRVVFLSLKQAFREGYAPARTSSPWPDADSR
jgi:micrococcal nuclease